MPESPSTSSSESGRRSFRFRPRYKLFAYGLLAVGSAFAAWPLLAGFESGARTLAIVIGIGCALLGVLYLVSPAWRIEVVVDDEGLEVLSGGDRKFRLAWETDDVVRVVASPATKTCFVDGGDPERSLKVPGKGAPAPYDIEEREALYDEILARVPADRVEEVTYLEVKTQEEST